MLITLEEAPLLQLYVVAPLAVKVAVCPVQIEYEEMLTAGNAVTLMVPMAADEQLAFVPVTV